MNIEQSADESPRDTVADFIARLQSGDYREAAALYEAAEDGDATVLNKLKKAYSNHTCSSYRSLKTRSQSWH